MKRLLPVLILCVVFAGLAWATPRHATLIPVSQTHERPKRHRAHKATRHHAPKRHHHTV